VRLDFRTKSNRRPFLINVKHNAISFMVDETNVYTFDRAGRLSTAVIERRTYRRGLNHRVMRRWHDADGSILRDWLSEEEIAQLIGHIQTDVGVAISALQKREIEDISPPDNPAVIDALLPWLGKISCCDHDALGHDAARANLIYRPVSILPPDQYLALVLQATEGCHYNSCSFCSFYRDRPFRIKPLAEFRQHISDVLDYLGDGLTLRRSVFLADANAVCVSGDSLLPLLDLVNETLPVGPRSPAVSSTSARMDGISSFVDAFSDRKGERPYEEMRVRNVRRLYLGVESGSGELLRFLRKPQTPEDIKRTVGDIKVSGINVGVILMLGIGGNVFAGRHVEESIALLNDLRLGKGDRVFLSPYVEFPDTEYPELARKAGITPLTGPEMARQYESIRSRIDRVAGHPVIAPYNAEEFNY
jgi:radical SAM superfamily enzyme YgiQ (UPF0313 family)